MRTVLACDVELSTLSVGEPSSRVTVCLHGLVTGNMATWYSTLALPLSTQRQVILYDLRGHGGSSVPSQGFDLDSQAADLAAILAELLPADSHVDLVGHSVGALIALQFALRYPQRVTSLVLVDAPVPANQWVGPSLVAATDRNGVAAWIDEQPLLSTAAVTGRRRERLRQRVERLLFDTTLVADVLAMGWPDPVALAALTVPTLLVYGRHSPCVSAGEALASTLATAELVLVDAGHDVPIQAAEPLLAHIQRFYAEQDARAGQTPAGAMA